MLSTLKFRYETPDSTHLGNINPDYTTTIATYICTIELTLVYNFSLKVPALSLPLQKLLMKQTATNTSIRATNQNRIVIVQIHNGVLPNMLNTPRKSKI